MSPTAAEFATLENDRVCVVVDMRNSAPKLMHIAAHAFGDPFAQSLALDPPVPAAGLSDLAPCTILPEASLGFLARPGIGVTAPTVAAGRPAWSSPRSRSTPPRSR